MKSILALSLLLVFTVGCRNFSRVDDGKGNPSLGVDDAIHRAAMGWAEFQVNSKKVNPVNPLVEICGGALSQITISGNLKYDHYSDQNKDVNYSFEASAGTPPRTADLKHYTMPCRDLVNGRVVNRVVDASGEFHVFEETIDPETCTLEVHSANTIANKTSQSLEIFFNQNLILQAIPDLIRDPGRYGPNEYTTEEAQVLPASLVLDCQI